MNRHTANSILLCIGFLWSITQCTAHAVELIQSIKRENHRITFITDPDIQHTYLREPFFVVYPKEINIHQLPDTIITIPFITSIMPIVWLSGKTYTIPAMDEDLFYSLERIRKVFKIFYPSTPWSGSLVPEKLIKNSPHSPIDTDAVALLFSHGLDAVHTALRHNDKQQLLITMWGSDVRPSQTALWQHVKHICQQYAHTHEKQHTWVKSNFMTFTMQKKFIHLCPDLKEWWGPTSLGMSYCGLAAPVLFARGYTRLLIAASFTNNTPYPYGSHPLIDNTLRFCGITIEHDGPATRNEKVRFIKEYCQTHNETPPLLRVCWGNDPQGGNCMKCEKCWRTVISLLFNGENPAHYGFTYSSREALAYAAYHVPKPYSLWGAHLWLWYDMHDASQEWLSEHLTDTTSSFYILCSLIANRNFQLPDDRLYSPAYTDLLKCLWHKSMSGTLTDLDLDQAVLSLDHSPI